jgi:hypothetical protein
MNKCCPCLSSSLVDAPESTEGHGKLSSVRNIKRRHLLSPRFPSGLCANYSRLYILSQSATPRALNQDNEVIQHPLIIRLGARMDSLVFVDWNQTDGTVLQLIFRRHMFFFWQSFERSRGFFWEGGKILGHSFLSYRRNLLGCPRAKGSDSASIG